MASDNLPVIINVSYVAFKTLGDHTGTSTLKSTMDEQHSCVGESPKQVSDRRLRTSQGSKDNMFVFLFLYPCGDF